MNGGRYRSCSGTGRPSSRIARCGSVFLILLGSAAVVASNATRAAAAFPGKNGKIAFQSDRDHSSNPGLFEIYAMNADGSHQTRLTFSGGAMSSWSPTGTRFRSHGTSATAARSG
jgi:hypothetical protein